MKRARKRKDWSHVRVLELLAYAEHVQQRRIV